MWSNKKSIILSIGVCLFVILALVVLLFFGPMFFRLYMLNYRGYDPAGGEVERLGKIFAGAFYPSAVFAGIMLVALLRLLFNIRKGDVFMVQNVKIFKTVAWCCFAISIITFICGFFYLPFIAIAAAGVFTGVLLRVLKNVMESAVELRAENDLTI